jgi:SnoaL-like protein
MDDWEVAARVAIDDLTGRYVRFADGGRAADLASLFTEDGVLVTDTDEVRGRPAISRYLDDAKSSLAESSGGGQIRHHVSSLRVDFPSRTEARATSYFLAITALGPDHWGRYRDRLVRVGDEWRFARRAAAVDGWAPGSWAAQRRGSSG